MKQYKLGKKAGRGIKRIQLDKATHTPSSSPRASPSISPIETDRYKSQFVSKRISKPSTSSETDETQEMETTEKKKTALQTEAKALRTKNTKKIAPMLNRLWGQY